ncbi:MAG: DoxX family protein [Candidatus Xenobia bacterium]
MWQRLESPMLSIARIVIGLLFMEHGAEKLFGWLGGASGHQPGQTVPLFSLMGLAGVIEFFGGLLIVLGLFTRIAAVLAAGEMAVGYFMVHAHLGFWPILNQGERAVFYCFFFLTLAALGPGEWSLDHALWGRPQPRAQRPEQPQHATDPADEGARVR